MPKPDGYRHGDRAALKKLVLYNRTDVVNLAELVQIALTPKSCLVELSGHLPIGKPWVVQQIASEMLA